MAACGLPGEVQGERPHEVECVYIPDTERGTLCVSSQVGCTLNCTFCHTGTQRLVSNLTAGEIVGQVLAARDRLGDWPGGTRPTDGVVPGGDRCITNIVMMGMGEPLYNFDAVRDAFSSLPMARASPFRSAASRCRPPASSPTSRARAPK